MQADILPDSRLKTVFTSKGLINRGAKGMWRPVFCANCGKAQGHVPDDPRAVREAYSSLSPRLRAAPFSSNCHVR